MKRSAANNNPRIHPVDGYPDTDNMWEKVWNLEKTDTPVMKHVNHRSEFLFQVNDNNKQFKVKKNPHYKRLIKELMT